MVTSWHAEPYAVHRRIIRLRLTHRQPTAKNPVDNSRTPRRFLGQRDTS
jgi:hypothetical protein